MPAPTRLARVIRLTAVARCERGNQWEDTVVHALRRKGWAIAAPVVASNTST